MLAPVPLATSATMSSPTGTLVDSSSSTPAPSVCGLCYRPFCGVARVYMPNCGCYLHTRCFVGFHIWHLNLEYMEAFFDAWHQHHMQGEDKASFRFPRHRKEMYWAELKCKTRSVETWRRQYLTRHALDLWYIFTVRAVSARAEKVLNLVRDWQRSEWDGWLARFLYLRDKALAVAILNAWLYDASMPALLDSSSGLSLWKHLQHKMPNYSKHLQTLKLMSGLHYTDPAN